MIKLWSFAPKARENFGLPLWSNYDHPPLWSFILSEFTWNKMIKLWSNIPLFRSDVHNSWSEKVENSRTQNRCTLLHRPLLSKHCHNSNTNTFGLGIANNMQCASRDLQSASRFSINFKFCLKKFRFIKMIKLWSFPNFWKTLPTIMIKLWSPTIMIIWSCQRLGWTKSGIMIDHFSGGPLYSKL